MSTYTRDDYAADMEARANAEYESRPRLIQYGGRTWKRRLAELAQIKLSVVPCSACGSPRHHPHVCPFCGGE